MEKLMKKYAGLIAVSLLLASSSVVAMNLVVGEYHAQGQRDTMEDASMKIPSQDGKIRVFGIFDGHCGAQTANYAAANMESAIVGDGDFAQNKEQALKNAFKKVSDECCQKFDDGATAIVAVVDQQQNRLWLANAGDSRCVVAYREGGIFATMDHTPKNPAEKTRLENTCDTDIIQVVQTVPRVLGYLMTSRTLGDRGWKYSNISRQLHGFPRILDTSKRVPEETQRDWISLHQAGFAEDAVISTPEVTGISSTNVDFMILACDGLWDVMSNEGAIDFVRAQMAIEKITPQTITGEKAELIAKRLVAHALNGHWMITAEKGGCPIYTPWHAKYLLDRLSVEEQAKANVNVQGDLKQSTDNVSAMIVFFKNVE